MKKRISILTTEYKKEYKKNYRSKNRERIRKQEKDYDDSHKEERREYSKKWRARNPHYGEKYRTENSIKCQLFQKEWRRNNRETRNKYQVKYYKNNKNKVHAHNIVNGLIKRGMIKKSSSCLVCGNDKGKIEAHHPDYNRPSYIIWICRGCHILEHRKDKV